MLTRTTRGWAALIGLVVASLAGISLAVPAAAATSTSIASSALTFPTTNGDVLALLDVTVSGQPVVVIGGDFSSIIIKGTSHPASNLAAVNETTGALVYAANGLGTNGYVRALAYAAGRLYVGGDFTSFSGAARHHLATLTVPGWSVSGWNPGASASVQAIAVDGAAVYLAGALGVVKALSLTTGKAIWSDPVVNGGVRALLVDDSNGGLYVAGFFDSVGGFANHGLVEVNKSNGAPLRAFKPVLQRNSGQGVDGSFDGEDPADLSLNTAVTPNQLLMGSDGHRNYVRMLNVTTGATIWEHFGPGDIQAVAVVRGSALVGYHRNRINNGNFHWPYFTAQLQAVGGAMQAWQGKLSGRPRVTDGGNNGIRAFAFDPVRNVLVVGGDYSIYGATCSPDTSLTCHGGVAKRSLSAYQVSPS